MCVAVRLTLSDSRFLKKLGRRSDFLQINRVVFECFFAIFSFVKKLVCQCLKLQFGEDFAQFVGVGLAHLQFVEVEFNRHVGFYRREEFREFYLFGILFNFFFSAPFSLSVCASSCSTPPNSLISFTAVFSPTPGHPGMLSAESPISPRRSIT